MRCSELRTISNAADSYTAPPQSVQTTQTQLFEGMLLEAALKPIADGLGVIGDSVTECVAQSVAHALASTPGGQ